MISFVKFLNSQASELQTCSYFNLNFTSGLDFRIVQHRCFVLTFAAAVTNFQLHPNLSHLKMPLFGADPVQKMQNQLFQLRFTAKSLVRESKKCEKDVKANKKKCKQAMEKGNIEGARIYAENAIRLHNQSLNYLKLSSRIDAVAARVNTAVQMGKVIFLSPFLSSIFYYPQMMFCCFVFLLD